MRRLAIAIVLTAAPVAVAWGPATHVYLAELATGSQRPEVHFGSVLADMNQMAFHDAEVADALRHLTHYEYDRIAPSCLALGFATHNEEWGADWYAHEYFLVDDPDDWRQYLTGKIVEMSETFDLRLVEAEFFLEFGIDYLLRLDEGPAIGRKLVAGAVAFGARQEQLAVDAFAEPLRAMLPRLSPARAEAEVRAAARRQSAVTNLYGSALMLNEDAVFQALTQFAAFYLGYSPVESAAMLAYAIDLCRDDYRAELDRIGDWLAEDMASYTEALDAPPRCSRGCAGPANGPGQASTDPVLAGLLALGVFRASRRAFCARRRDASA